MFCISVAASIRFAEFDEAIDMFVNAARMLANDNGDDGQVRHSHGANS